MNLPDDERKRAVAEVARRLGVSEEQAKEMFVAVAAKALPPDHPDAPKYWMAESSGVLRPAVEKYLDGKLLTLEQLAAMKAYLRQWVNSPAWDLGPLTEAGRKELQSLRKRVADIYTDLALREAIDVMTDMGMDPL